MSSLERGRTSAYKGQGGWFRGLWAWIRRNTIRPQNLYLEVKRLDHFTRSRGTIIMQTRSCFRKPGLWDSSFDMIGKHIGAEEDRDGGSAVRILFCNIARMKYYKGIVPGVDEPKFGGAYVAQTGDAGEQYNFAPLKTDTGELRTMPGVKNLIRYQQNIAAESGIAFWNMFEAMGGDGSMAKLVHAKPSMANYDYTHINFRGGKYLAGLLYETLIYGKEQYDRRHAYETE